VKKFPIVLLLLAIDFVKINVAQSVNYLWPTNASQYLTSSFAEFRPGHFHAGIDIKTWGTVGYEVYAIRDGYIMRISTSPFGYGKVIYQKLDNGETAVYAHLDRFNEQIEKFVRQEQKRSGEYRINKYLSSFRFPVKKGDIIGYTGSTGVGYPHLHFELRDGYNNPINPFLKGYHVKDTIPPYVEKVCITPLNANSRVNSDVLYWVVRPKMINSRLYRVVSKPTVSGEIGFAIECYDRANEVSNSFSVYRLDFYIDEQLKFSVSYDRFSYGQTHFIDFDRDYRLRKRGIGIFQNLYQAKFNELRLYKPVGDQVGIVFCDPGKPNTFSSEKIIGAGEHEYKIELLDFWGNTTTVTGAFMVGKTNLVAADFPTNNSGTGDVSVVGNDNGASVVAPTNSIDKDSSSPWQYKFYSTLQPDGALVNDSVFKSEINHVRPQDIIKTDTAIQKEMSAVPLFQVVKDAKAVDKADGKILVDKDFYNDYLRLKIVTAFKPLTLPKVVIQQSGGAQTLLSLLQKKYNEFVGIYPLQSGKDGLASIVVAVNNGSNKPIVYEEQFELQTITPFEGGSIISQNGNCQLTFAGNKVYENLFLRMETNGKLKNGKYEIVGNIYEINPQDIPLKGSGTLTMRYPPSDTLPEKLGIYSGNENYWRFISNRLDKLSFSISTTITNLGNFTLIRDTIPPFISILHPLKNSRTKNKKPEISVIIFDNVSGLASERSITVKLDEQKVIAEYDPETKMIKYKSEEPLAPGEHKITVAAFDNCKNRSRLVQSFYVLQ